MFNAKSLLEALVGAANPAPQAQSQQPGLGGLADILGQVMGQGQNTGAAAPGGGGGLADILGKMMQGGGGQPGATPQAPGAAGGLGDILAQLQKQLGQGGQAPGGQQQSGGGGGLMDILGQVLGQATSGVKEGAGKLDDMTGASGHARDAIGQATGKSPEELLQQLKDLIANNPTAAAAGAGGLGAIVLGTGTGRSVAASAAKLGALVLIGGLAYKAYQNYSAGRPMISAPNFVPEAAPHGSGFEPLQSDFTFGRTKLVIQFIP